MIQIVGAGFSGLMTAYYLVKAGHKVRILEQSAGAGGLIHTLQNQYGFVETAANGMLNCEELQSISRDIAVPLIETKKESRKRYIFLQSPRRWPLSFAQSMGSIHKLLRFGFFRTQNLKPKKNETLELYGKRVFGSAVTYQLLEPALRGVYAGQIRDISASLIFSKYFDKNRTRMKSTVSPEKGMGAWIQGLESWLRNQGVEIVYGHTVKPAELQHGLWILATSAVAASSLLAQASSKTADLLKQVEMLPVITVTLFFSRKEKLTGFGVLFPETEKFNALGVLFNHDIFSGRSEMQSETWILGGAHNKGLIEKSDEEIERLIVEDRNRIFPEGNTVVERVVTKWPQALPHYTVDLENILPKIELPKNIHLVGNYLGNIGLSQIIFQAKAEAERWSH